LTSWRWRIRHERPPAVAPAYRTRPKYITNVNITNTVVQQTTITNEVNNVVQTTTSPNKVQLARPPRRGGAPADAPPQQAAQQSATQQQAAAEKARQEAAQQQADKARTQKAAEERPPTGWNARPPNGAPPADQPGVTTSGPIRVAEDVQAAKLISQPRLKYPPDAKAGDIQGMVRVHVLIGTDGKVKSATVPSATIGRTGWDHAWSQPGERPPGNGVLHQPWQAPSYPRDFFDCDATHSVGECAVGGRP